jgi:4-amino-4-deoxy-L-arabinose transferase-like glycosyltransferase
LYAPGTWRRRIGQLLAAGLMLALVSLSWMTIVQLTPASQRPFVGSTADNSEFNLAIDYNGFGRVGGQTGGPGQIPVTKGLPGTPGLLTAAGQAQAARQKANASAAPGGPLIVFGGPASPIRLINHDIGTQGGWLWPFALAGLIGIAIVARRTRGDPDPRFIALVVLGGWFLIETLILDFGQGIIHPYYVSALGPGLAVLVGAGGVCLVEGVRTRGLRTRRWLVGITLLALVCTIAAQFTLIHFSAYPRLHELRFVFFAGAALGGAAFLAWALRPARLPRWAGLASLGVALGFLTLSPAAFSATTWKGPDEGTFPAAGFRQGPSEVKTGVRRTPNGADRPLEQFLASHDPGTRWWLMTTDALNAAPLVIDGLPVAGIGGYNSTDATITAKQLALYVERGEARYFELGGAFGDRGGNAALNAVARSCVDLPPGEWSGIKFHHTKTDPLANGAGYAPGGLTLWDCKGRGPEIARQNLIVPHL